MKKLNGVAEVRVLEKEGPSVSAIASAHGEPHEALREAHKGCLCLQSVHPQHHGQFVEKEENLKCAMLGGVGYCCP